MSWFRKKKQTVEPDLDRAQWAEADRALAKSRLETAQVMSEWPRVEEASEVLTRQLEENSFSERIRAAYSGSGG